LATASCHRAQLAIFRAGVCGSLAFREKSMHKGNIWWQKIIKLDINIFYNIGIGDQDKI
jgi:hypothetical protein